MKNKKREIKELPVSPPKVKSVGFFPLVKASAKMTSGKVYSLFQPGYWMKLPSNVVVVLRAPLVTGATAITIAVASAMTTSTPITSRAQPATATATGQAPASGGSRPPSPLSGDILPATGAAAAQTLVPGGPSSISPTGALLGSTGSPISSIDSLRFGRITLKMKKNYAKLKDEQKYSA